MPHRDRNNGFEFEEEDETSSLCPNLRTFSIQIIIPFLPSMEEVFLYSFFFVRRQKQSASKDNIRERKTMRMMKRYQKRGIPPFLRVCLLAVVGPTYSLLFVFLVGQFYEQDMSLASSTAAILSTALESDNRSAILQGNLTTRISSDPHAEKSVILNPIMGMVRSFPVGNHDPTQRRSCFALTAVPEELGTLQKAVDAILQFTPYKLFDCIHLSIPDRPMRFQQDENRKKNRSDNKSITHSPSYPTTNELLSVYSKHPRVIIHRLFDYGPMTRYIGPLVYEQNPDTSLVIFDMDSYKDMFSTQRDLGNLVRAANYMDQDAMWCYQGENFLYDESTQKIKPNWDLFPLVRETEQVKRAQSSNRTESFLRDWNYAHFCRGTSGMLFKPKHFRNFFWNQSDYHESCFWDDDRWVSYQMERQKIPIKLLHPADVPTQEANPLNDENKQSQTSLEQQQGTVDALEDFPRRRLGTLTGTCKIAL